jgi:mRNA interferase MazF
MAERVNRGEIWLLALPRPDKRRPVLVLTRPSLIRLLHTVTVAAITSTLRGSPTEVDLGPAEGLKQTSCVNLCNLDSTAGPDDVRRDCRLGEDGGSLPRARGGERLRLSASGARGV